jgi:ribosome maturation factor RimP
MAFPSEQELREIAEPLAASLGFDVEAVNVTRAGAKSAVRLAVDGDTRPDLDQLEELSQAVSAEFDARETAGTLNFGPGYTLELTTPGLDTPLTAGRHFRRNVGRLVLLRGEKLRIAGVDEGSADGDGGDATVWLIRPAVKKKDAPTVLATELAEAAGALVEVEFSDAPAAESELVGLDPEKYRALTAQEDDK